MKPLHLSFAILASIAPEPASGNTTAPIEPAAETVCAVKNASLRKYLPRPRLVTITAHPGYDRHSGYYLSDPGCTDRVDGTGLIQIEFPNGRRIAEYPELNKTTNQSFLAANNGKRLHIKCIGTVSYAKRQTRFLLQGDCEVWATAAT